MNENPYQGSNSKAQWASNQIQAAERNEGAYRASLETGLRSWHWVDKMTTLIPAAIAGLFVLLVLFWIIRLIMA